MTDDERSNRRKSIGAAFVPTIGVLIVIAGIVKVTL